MAVRNSAAAPGVAFGMRKLSLCLLAACGAPSRPAAPEPPPVAVLPPMTVPAPSPVTADASLTASVAARPDADQALAGLRRTLTAAGDLDDKPGDERVTLGPDGILKVGTLALPIELARSDDAFDKQYRLEVVSLGGKRRGVLVAAPTAESEDPPNRFRVYLFDGGTLRPVFDEVIGVYGATDLAFAADGTASYTESGWMACERVQHKRDPNAQRVTLALDAAGKAMKVKRRVDTKDVRHCGELSACPFVYRLGDGEPQQLGEILRNVRGRAAATVQDLAVGAAGGGLITLRLAEEKPEVTYLDEIYLEVDGMQIAPRACIDDRAATYCSGDGRHHVLRERDTLDLTFDTPPHAASRLVARGYYVPTPTAATRDR